MSNKPKCYKCGEEKTHVDEPMVSGVVGWFCMNDDCVIDS
jgi:hypothetical protein